MLIPLVPYGPECYALRFTTSTLDAAAAALPSIIMGEPNPEFKCPCLLPTWSGVIVHDHHVMQAVP